MILNKKIIFVTVSIIILFSILNTFSYFYIDYNYNKVNINGKYFDKKKYSKGTLITYEKYLNKLHHLRDPYLYKEEQLLFNKIGEGTTVLIQGDSWAERFSESVDTRKVFAEFSKLKNVKFILSGTSSYSPSLYQAQLQVLKSDFNINPEVLISLFDQTDIGDELCRYKLNRYSENENVFVKKYSSPKEGKLYYMDFYLERIKILTSNKVSFLKLVLLINSKIIEKYFTEFEKTCTFDKITRPLVNGLSSEEFNYFKKVVDDYLNYIFNKTEIKKMIIFTHPHLNNINNNYKINISSVLKRIIDKSAYKNKILIYNFTDDFVSKYIEKSKNKEFICIFVPGDNASHLCDVYQYKIIVPEMLKIASKIM